MSAFARQRKNRLRDFERRVELDDDVRTYRDWRYVTVHPFADEPKLLASLELQPAECQNADVWWHTGSDIVLLQTTVVGEAGQSTTCCWFGDPPYLSIIARLSATVATIRSLHDAMDRISSCGIPKRCKHRSRRSRVTLFRW